MLIAKVRMQMKMKTETCIIFSQPMVMKMAINLDDDEPDEDDHEDECHDEDGCDGRDDLMFVAFLVYWPPTRT